MISDCGVRFSVYYRETLWSYGHSGSVSSIKEQLPIIGCYGDITKFVFGLCFSHPRNTVPVAFGGMHEPVTNSFSSSFPPKPSQLKHYSQ